MRTSLPRESSLPGADVVVITFRERTQQKKAPERGDVFSDWSDVGTAGHASHQPLAASRSLGTAGDRGDAGQLVRSTRPSQEIQQALALGSSSRSLRRTKEKSHR